MRQVTQSSLPTSSHSADLAKCLVVWTRLKGARDSHEEQNYTKNIEIRDYYAAQTTVFLFFSKFNFSTMVDFNVKASVVTIGNIVIKTTIGG